MNKKSDENIYFFSIFFFKSVQIYMKDKECSVTNEKSILRFFRFLVFELWSFLYSKCGQFSMNFLDDSKKKNRKYFCLFYIRYKTFFNYLEQKIETALFEWRVGGLQIAN